MDFFKVNEGSTKKGVIEVYPDFSVARTTDLMVRGGEAYAIWDEEKGLWSTDEYDIPRLIDKEIARVREETEKRLGQPVQAKYASSFSSGVWPKFLQYVKGIKDNYHELDAQLTFSNTEVKKTDYVSKRLSYPLEEGSIDAYDELIGTLYEEPERAKLEWAVGAVIAGDARHIQKFLVLYGSGGSGKSTFLNIVESLFQGYTSKFGAKELASNNNAFAAAAFKNNPLVAIQHDGDLSKIEDNTILNSIVSHEEILVNEKYKSPYEMRTNSLLLMGTNTPVKITDSKSGLIRRLIDVSPSGKRVSASRYHILMQKIEFELSAIAFHCLKTYREMGREYYSAYRPLRMMFNTDVCYNFVSENYLQFKAEDGVTLKQAYTMYKEYCNDSSIDRKLPMYKFREELKAYFTAFSDRGMLGGEEVRSVYTGFLAEKFESTVGEGEPETHAPALILDEEHSLLDEMLADCPAQYANEHGTPAKKWEYCETTLKDLDTSLVHYVRVPENHIVVDFDLADDDGQKSFERNLEAASLFPPTYAETSKSGGGIHLHYLWEGDDRLAAEYAPGIEIKQYTGLGSLRRRVGRCNSTPVASLNHGLPLREHSVINTERAMSEKGLRELIARNLRKEIHPGTKPSVDFIEKILDDMYKSGKPYDVTDLRPRIMAFANNSTNQADLCLKAVARMKFQSAEEVSGEVLEPSGGTVVSVNDKMDDLVFFDVEVFPNLLLVVYKQRGKDNCVRLINPTPQQIEAMLGMKLVGFNNRRYDNHILYAAYMGYNNLSIYNLSQSMINNSPNAGFLEAYNLSFLDVWEMSSKKMTLKKFEIELGIHHKELGLPWDEPAPEEMWDKIAEYCENDVVATEAVFEARHEDFVARQILAAMSGLSINEKTQNHTKKIIFGNTKRPQDEFEYTDLSEMFPGYEYSFGKSTYRGENPSEGGYVYAEPGMYEDVALLDVASLHPTSLVAMNYFGPYTENFNDLLKARLAIKHEQFDEARQMLGGKLAPFLEDESQAGDLSYALKIAINIVYGMTSAKYDNPFKDPRNVDNIVAKRGALFMIDLKHMVQEAGFTVAHIKTDSIKIPNATPEIIEKVMEFGKQYGYTFEHEATYSKLCLVNEAVYIAKVGWAPKASKIGTWTATGAQFQQPYVFKTLFSKETCGLQDVSETKTVTTSMYLDFNESLAEGEHNYHFVGKAGRFTPVLPGYGGGTLLREKDGKYYAVGGTKGYRWMETEVFEKDPHGNSKINHDYHNHLVDEAVKTISKFGDFDRFAND